MLALSLLWPASLAEQSGIRFSLWDYFCYIIWGKKTDYTQRTQIPKEIHKVTFPFRSENTVKINCKINPNVKTVAIYKDPLCPRTG